MNNKDTKGLSSPSGGQGAEISFIIEQLKDAYEGDPWFGRNIKSLLADVEEQAAFEKVSNQHSILDLVWHMITWREFAIDRLQQKPQMQLKYFEQNDWRQLDYSNKTLWQQVLERLQQTQDELIQLLKKQKDEILDKPIPERNYTFRKLLHGIIQHDVYHMGQVAYIQKIFLQNTPQQR
ncbi:MAG: DinB family protein [Flavisolibacter sp.]|nr:DinB family protein [Flavisolibacter sp.]